MFKKNLEHYMEKFQVKIVEQRNRRGNFTTRSRNQPYDINFTPQTTLRNISLHVALVAGIIRTQGKDRKDRGRELRNAKKNRTSFCGQTNNNVTKL